MIKKNTPLQDIMQMVHACRCAECESGCRYGSGIFTLGQEKKAAALLSMKEGEFKKKFLEEAEHFNKKFYRPRLRLGNKPYGPCIFFDEEKKCIIHTQKPMQCTLSMSCKDYGEDIMIWFMLNFIIDKDDPECIRQFASYLASGGKTIEGGSLQDFVPDKRKLAGILSFESLK